MSPRADHLPHHERSSIPTTDYVLTDALPDTALAHPAVGRSCRCSPRVVSPVMTVCELMRYWPQMLAVAQRETRSGRIVLAPFVVLAPDAQDTRGKEQLDAQEPRDDTTGDAFGYVTPTP